MARIQGSVPKLDRYLRETTYLEELKTGEYVWPGGDRSFQLMWFGLANCEKEKFLVQSKLWPSLCEENVKQNDNY